MSDHVNDTFLNYVIQPIEEDSADQLNDLIDIFQQINVADKQDYKQFPLLFKLDHTLSEVFNSLFNILGNAIEKSDLCIARTIMG